MYAEVVCCSGGGVWKVSQVEMLLPRRGAEKCLGRRRLQCIPCMFFFLFSAFSADSSDSYIDFLFNLIFFVC